MTYRAFPEGVASVWPLDHTGQIGGLLQRWLTLWMALPSPVSTEEQMSFDRVTNGLLVTSITKALLHQPLGLDGWQVLGGLQVLLKFLHFRKIEVSLYTGTVNAAEMFL